MWLNPASGHFDPGRQFAFLRAHEGRGALVVANFGDAPADVKLNISDDAFSYLGIARCDRFFETIHIEPHDSTIIMTE